MVGGRYDPCQEGLSTGVAVVLLVDTWKEQTLVQGLSLGTSKHCQSMAVPGTTLLATLQGPEFMRFCLSKWWCEGAAEISGNEKFIYYTIVPSIQMTASNRGETEKLMEKLKVWLNVLKHLPHKQEDHNLDPNIPCKNQCIATCF